MRPQAYAPEAIRETFHAATRQFLASEWNCRIDREHHKAQQGCVLCFPVLKSTGEFHACPLAIENPAPHFRLGDLTTPPNVLLENYRQFRTWATTVLDPAARQRQITSCPMCQQHLDALPDYCSRHPYQHAQHHAQQHLDAGARKEEYAHE